MRIYTKTGDDGTTGLFGGSRVPKDDLRIEAYGTIDELNAFIGKLAENPEFAEHLEFFREIQSDLFLIGSHLATADEKMREKLPKFNPESTARFEAWMDDVSSDLPDLKNFLLPGGHPSVADAHIARTVCRRAERRVVSLAREAEVEKSMIIYLNRLSDLLFTTARMLSHLTKTKEIAWRVGNK